VIRSVSDRDKLIIGTRGSKLALWQSNYIKGLVEQITGLPVELKVIKTTGDKILDVPLAKVGGKGLFTKELEVELAAGLVDLCVHSMKDVPTELPEGLYIAAMPPRVDPRDALVSGAGYNLETLPKGSRVGTSSLRRVAQVRASGPTYRSWTFAATWTHACARPRKARSTWSSLPAPASRAWAGPIASQATSRPHRWSRRSAKGPSASRSARTTSCGRRHGQDQRPTTLPA
jgi:hypothetical protein